MGAAYCILAIGLLSTAVLCYQFRRQFAGREQARFQESSLAAVKAAQLHLRSHVGLLQSLRGLYLASPNLSQTEWTNFFRSVSLKDGFAGLVEVSVVGRVAAPERKRHVAAMRQRGAPDYHVWPETDQHDLFPVLYSYPCLPLLLGERLGWDAASENDSRVAMRRAGDLSQPIATRMMPLAGLEGEHPFVGFRLFLPIYNPDSDLKTATARSRTLSGFVVGTYRLDALWADVIAHSQHPSIAVEVLDGNQTDDSQNLAGSRSRRGLPEVASIYSQDFPLTTLGHTWILRCSAAPTVAPSWSQGITPLIFCSGVCMSLLLFAIACAQARGRRASDLLRTELQESEERLRRTNVRLQQQVLEGDKAQRQLAAAHELAWTEQGRLAVTLRSIGDAVVSTDIQGRIILFNEAAERLTCLRSAETLKRPLDEVFQLYARQTQEPLTTSLAPVLEHGETVTTPPGTLLQTQSGSFKSVSVTIAPIRGEGNKTVGAVVVARDITEQEQVETELIRARRLESITILARGLAHDFNTLLTGILGNVSVGRMFAAADSTLDERLSQAEKACLRAKELTERLLSFASTGVAASRPVSIAELLRDTANVALEETACQCECTQAPDLWPVQIEESQICQVIYDLVVNASEAMGGQGQITIDARNAVVEPGSPLALTPGRFIRIDVRDEGAGIAPEHRTRLFDPYFTTKQDGSGLGLAAAYFTVQRHRGLIEVDSEVGHGTTVRLYLPAILKKVPKRVEPPMALPGLNGRVLLMDDESLILNLGAVVLKRLGYDVALARDGEEAVQRYEEARRAGEPFSVVILDLVVQGGMGGDETVKRLLRIDPAVKAIVSSGYHNDPVIVQYQEHGFAGAITKPYHASDLAKLMSKILNEARPSPR